ncbi:PhzF family phenazine biosynthesis protein [Motilibacter rhizosphaerae]|uniref:PhzF family phenazine biosynthesis protein n=1 Tax=Motilibacter rhizosphaerae TaxID=598652 RepID=A0A4Q7NAR3_9ACTN|nr:PhzF family phenazine biosynthesis protein [Motilibacter rhizosphaerae]RZS80031.1 PhzF family phenazine biosynthesis protein [Motilibacter rhizosphaerae]
MHLHVVSVFVGPDGRGGNPLGAFVDQPELPAEQRQAVAAELGFSETVFVRTSGSAAVVQIHTPAVELPLAGHPLVGTAWLLARLGSPVDVLRPPAGEVPTWTEGATTWIRARAAWAPEFESHQLGSAAEVDAHPGAGPGAHLHVWAWEDEAAGRVRVRVFPTAMGIVEDEATGAAAIRLGAALQRDLVIRQGVGSEILVRYAGDGVVEVGGAVVAVEERELPSSGSSASTS